MLRFKGKLGACGLVMSWLIASSSNSFAQSAPFDRDNGGALYVLTNSRTQNAVVEWRRDDNGNLIFLGEVPTGGTGTGDFLDAQGSLVLSPEKDRLFAVNALSNEISAFAVHDDGTISLTDKVDSGGERPNSLTVRGNLLYVLNSGGSGNITAFHVSPNGRLSPIVDSNRDLSTRATLFPCPRQGDAGRICSAAAPAQVQFNPAGDLLIVTERFTSRVLVYRVSEDGRASLANIFQSLANSSPFGFAFAPHERLIVSDNFLDEPGLGAASAFVVHEDGDLQQITGPLANEQTSSCWVVVTKNGRFAITANPRTSSLTTYRIHHDGSIAVHNAVTAVVNGDPHDLSLSGDGRFLFALNNQHGTISSFRVEQDGNLIPLAQPAAADFPAFSVGMAAR